MSCWRDCLLNVLVVMIGRVSIWLWQGRWHFSFFLDKYRGCWSCRNNFSGVTHERRTVPKISSVAQGASS